MRLLGDYETWIEGNKVFKNILRRKWAKSANGHLGAIQIIRDTFLACFRPPSVIWQI